MLDGRRKAAEGALHRNLPRGNCGAPGAVFGTVVSGCGCVFSQLLQLHIVLHQVHLKLVMYLGTLPPLDGPNLKIACLPWMSKLSNVPLSARYRLIMTQVMVDSSHETTPTLGGMRAYP